MFCMADVLVGLGDRLPNPFISIIKFGPPSYEWLTKIPPLLDGSKVNLCGNPIGGSGCISYPAPARCSGSVPARRGRSRST